MIFKCGIRMQMPSTSKPWAICKIWMVQGILEPWTGCRGNIFKDFQTRSGLSTSCIWDLFLARIDFSVSYFKHMWNETPLSLVSLLFQLDYLIFFSQSIASSVQIIMTSSHMTHVSVFQIVPIIRLYQGNSYDSVPR